MKGRVIHIHHQRGMVAVESDDGEYSITQHDSRRHQIEAARAVALLLGAAVTNFA